MVCNGLTFHALSSAVAALHQMGDGVGQRRLCRQQRGHTVLDEEIGIPLVWPRHRTDQYSLSELLGLRSWLDEDRIGFRRFLPDLGIWDSGSKGSLTIKGEFQVALNSQHHVDNEIIYNDINMAYDHSTQAINTHEHAPNTSTACTHHHADTHKVDRAHVHVM